MVGRRIYSELTATTASNDSRRRFWATVLNPSDEHPSSSSSSSGPVRCNECGQMFRSVPELATHKARHRRSVRTYRCSSGCERDFTQTSHLNQHVRTVHRNLKPFACDECPRSFGKRFDLTSHKSAVHANERPHVCRVCRKAFAKRSNLVRHENKLHPEYRHIVSVRTSSTR